MDKSEESILFPEIEVAGYTLKPWSFGMLFKLSTFLGTVIEKAEAKNLIDEITSSIGFLSYTTLAKLFSIAGPEVMEIIMVTVGISRAEVEALSMENGLKIAIGIYNVNKDVITNAIKNALSTPLAKEGVLEEKEKQQ